MNVLTPLVALAASQVAVITSTALRGRWEGRGITAIARWHWVNALAAVLGIGAYALTLPAGILPAAATAVATGMTVIASATDLHCHKAPRELPHVVAFVGLACAAPTVITNPIPTLTSLAVAFVGLVAIPWAARALTRNGLGFSDIRILWAFTATLSWWTGFVPLIWALIAACLLQIVLRVAVPRRILGRENDTATGRTRRELPFAPALCTAFVAAAIFCAQQGQTVCTSLGVC